MSKTFEQGKEEVAALCRYFATNRQAFTAPGVKEADIRQSLIDPLFEALGWDMRNRAMVAPQYREVIPEPSLDVEGQQKAPDYTFRVGPLPKFYTEANKCGVNIQADPAPAYQLRRYGWSAKVAVSILTNFEELSVYDCTFRPRPSDKASRARILYFRCEEYPERWQELWDVLSREAVWSGAFDQFAASKRKRGTSEVDAEFLKEIEGWRESLARNIALRNKGQHFTSDELNSAVQMTIDRVVFLRMAEDRGLEPEQQLLRLCDAPEIYRRFMRDVCRRADEKYNSGLFHFQSEPDVSEPPDTTTPALAVDDRTFRAVLQSLYFVHGSPYDFRVMPVEILGTVYERFLGKAIRLTSGNHAKVESKPEVKARGVYYTPSYLVDFVVEHAVGRQIAGRSPAQLAGLRNGKQPFRVLDMACGSGSFLLGAYRCLLDRCLDWYVEHRPSSHKRAVYREPRRGEWRLTIAEKKRILTTHLFGVDIDPQAVEVSKLSLLLKALEGESDATLAVQLNLFHDRALPNLAENIKCGNSLIGSDYFAGAATFDSDEARRINPFDWANEFPRAMRAGGFDCIIGNPPWGATFGEGELEYLRVRHNRVVARMVDSYIYFTDQALRLTKDSHPIGYVVPATILNQVDAQPLRELLRERGLSVLVSLGQGVFGRKALNTSSVFVSSKPNRLLKVGDLSDVRLVLRPAALTSLGGGSYRQWERAVKNDPHHTFFARDLAESTLLDRLRRRCRSLESIIDGNIQRGVSPDVAAAHVLSRDEASRRRLEPELLRQSVSGSQIKRYQPWESDQAIIYTTRDTPIREFPRCYAYLAAYRERNTCQEVAARRHPWWSLHRPRDPAIFVAPKIIGLTTTKTIELAFDESTGLCVTDAMYVFRPISGINCRALMAVMQSKFFHFLYRVANIGEARVIPQIKASKLLTLPVPDPAGGDELAKLAERMLTLNVQLRHAKAAAASVVQREIEATDAKIDALVYRSYGLTDREIAIVERTEKRS